MSFRFASPSAYPSSLFLTEIDETTRFQPAAPLPVDNLAQAHGLAVDPTLISNDAEDEHDEHVDENEGGDSDKEDDIEKEDETEAN